LLTKRVDLLPLQIRIKILWRIWPFARQWLGKNRLKAGIVEPDMELSICWATVHARFRDNAFMKSSSEHLEAVTAIRSFRHYKREFISQFERHPCGGGVEYLHRDPASHRRRRKGKSQIWDSIIRSRVPRDSDPRMTALARPAAIVNDRPVLSSDTAPHINKPATVWQL
jgi:hypothetical protein